MPEQKRPARNNRRHIPPGRNHRRYMPAELVEEILLHLPLKSLLRFSSVSKSWNSIILGSEFVKRYRGREMIVLKPYSSGRLRNALVCPLSFISPDNPIGDATPLVHPFKEGPYLHASCDELWCVQVQNSLFLWNPLMQTYRKLPPRPGTLFMNGFVYGLGYDSVGDDYKILKIPKYDDSATESYSLRGDSWRKIRTFPEKHILSEYGLSVSGALHWMVRRESTCVIISFDLSTEKYGEVALPEYHGRPEINMTVLRGMLCFYVNYYYYEETRFVMWMMEDYGVGQSSWTEEFDINYGHIPRVRNLRNLRPYYFYDDDHNLIIAFSSPIDIRVIFTCKDNSTLVMKNIVKNVDHTFYRSHQIFNSFIYVESLVSPDIWPTSAATVS